MKCYASSTEVVLNQTQENQALCVVERALLNGGPFADRIPQRMSEHDT